MFRLEPTSQFLERYRSVVSCAVNSEDPISKFFVNFFSSREIYKLF
jgi:hypothetical protein